MADESGTRRLEVDEFFDLKKILDGTQDFRWCRWKDGWYSGVLRGTLIHIRDNDGVVEYRAKSDVEELLRRYFRLNDIDSVREELSECGERIASLTREYPYLRVLRHPDPWQSTVSYIVSARNRIRGISTLVERVAEIGGTVTLDGDARNTFPTPKVVLAAGETGELKLGAKRARYVLAAAERICAPRDGQQYVPRLNLGCLAKPDVCYAEAKRRLMAVPGVGDKVADCISLFALDKTEAFPVDMYVREAMESYFSPKKQPPDDELVLWAQDRFGEHAGYASQLLFTSAYFAKNADAPIRDCQP